MFDFKNPRAYIPVAIAVIVASAFAIATILSPSLNNDTILPILFLVVCISAIAFSARREIKAKNALAQHAKTLGLKDFGTGTFRGSWNEYTVEISIVQSDNNRNKTYTLIQTHAQTRLLVEIEPEHIHHQTARAFKLAQEVTLGDKAFDDQFWIQSHSPTRTERLLTAPIREKILRYNSSLHPFHLKNDILSATIPDIVDSVHRLRITLNAQTQILQELDRQNNTVRADEILHTPQHSQHQPKEIA